MKNFLLFCLVAIVLTAAGYFGYNVYHKDKTWSQAWGDLVGSASVPGAGDVSVELEQAAQHYRVGEFEQAAALYEELLQNHDAGEPGARIDKENLQQAVRRAGMSFYRVWSKQETKSSETRAKAELYLSRYERDYPDARDSRASSALRRLEAHKQ